MPADKTQAVMIGGEKTNLLKQQSQVIAALTGLDVSRLQIEETIREKPEQSMAQVVGPVEIYLPLAGMTSRAAARKQLTKELENSIIQINRLEKLLSSDFANKAPASVVDKEREKLATFKETAQKLKVQLDR